MSDSPTSLAPLLYYARQDRQIKQAPPAERGGHGEDNETSAAVGIGILLSIKYCVFSTSFVEHARDLAWVAADRQGKPSQELLVTGTMG